jgi:hypothetical protein
MSTQADPIRWTCACGKHFSVSAKRAGLSYNCPKCGAAGRVPGPSDTAVDFADLVNPRKVAPVADDTLPMSGTGAPRGLALAPPTTPARRSSWPAFWAFIGIGVGCAVGMFVGAALVRPQIKEVVKIEYRDRASVPAEPQAPKSEPTKQEPPPSKLKEPVAKQATPENEPAKTSNPPTKKTPTYSDEDLKYARVLLVRIPFLYVAYRDEGDRQKREANALMLRDELNAVNAVSKREPAITAYREFRQAYRLLRLLDVAGKDGAPATLSFVTDEIATMAGLRFFNAMHELFPEPSELKAMMNAVPMPK